MLYFDWLVDYIKTSSSSKYSKLLSLLFDIPFQYTYEMDENRAKDGISLRELYSRHYPNDEFSLWSITHGCSWLEMMIALAVRCEDIMCEPDKDTTSKWFWGMIDSLYLSDQIDDRFDSKTVIVALERVKSHLYRADGFGGLFYVPGLIGGDMRQQEIWNQAMLYLGQF